MTTIKPPKNPITLALNGWLTDNYIKSFFNEYLPNYEPVFTSGYRTEEHNRDIGGAADSSHLYNLGKDFALKNKATGVILNDTQAKKVYNEAFPYWEGYAKFYPTAPGGNSHHIHANLDREITNYTKYIGIAVMAAGAVYVFNKYKGQFTKKRNTK